MQEQETVEHGSCKIKLLAVDEGPDITRRELCLTHATDSHKALKLIRYLPAGFPDSVNGSCCEFFGLELTISCPRACTLSTSNPPSPSLLPLFTPECGTSRR